MTIQLSFARRFNNLDLYLSNLGSTMLFVTSRFGLCPLLYFKSTFFHSSTNYLILVIKRCRITKRHGTRRSVSVRRRSHRGSSRHTTRSMRSAATFRPRGGPGIVMTWSGPGIVTWRGPRVMTWRGPGVMTWRMTRCRRWIRSRSRRCRPSMLPGPFFSCTLPFSWLSIARSYGRLSSRWRHEFSRRRCCKRRHVRSLCRWSVRRVNIIKMRTWSMEGWGLIHGRRSVMRGGISRGSNRPWRGSHWRRLAEVLFKPL